MVQNFFLKPKHQAYCRSKVELGVVLNKLSRHAQKTNPLKVTLWPHVHVSWSDFNPFVGP